MDEVYVIQSEKGDGYKIQLTTQCSGLIALDLLNHINSDGVY